MMDAIPTIAENFEAYRALDLLNDPPAEVVEFVRSAFYAGAGSTLRIIDTIKRTADTPAMGIAAIAALDYEMDQYAMECLIRTVGHALGDKGVMLVRVTRVEKD
jgi:hypothetical protein